MNEKKIAKVINAELAKMLENGFISEKQFESITDTVNKTAENFKQQDSTIEVIDERHVLFDSEVYTKSKQGYFFRNKPLHVSIYEYFHNIKVPKGYIIHHVDFNPENNDIENLQMVTAKEHHQIHNLPSHLKTKIFLCQMCGKTFSSLDSGKRCYCSTVCKRLADKENKRVEKVCVVCGRTFLASNKKTKCCSNTCRGKMSWDNESERKRYDLICQVCGKKYKSLRPYSKYCSRKCKDFKHHEEEKAERRRLKQNK